MEAAIMAYFAINRLAFALVLSLGFASTLAQAQQLQQPASVLPWAGSQPEIKLALRPPVAKIPEDSPGWLVEPVKQPFETAPPKTGLHMVETEKFVDLGPLEAEPTQAATSRGARTRNHAAAASRPWNIFKALGIQANRQRA